MAGNLRDFAAAVILPATLAVIPHRHIVMLAP
jgi:hypothetical protein